MKTVITELLGIEYPVIQGGMAWVGTAELAAAVSEAGGLGIIGAGGAPASWVEEQIHKVKEKTDKPFGVNLMLLNPEADAIAELLVKEEVKVVTTGAGNPEKYMEECRCARHSSCSKYCSCKANGKGWCGRGYRRRYRVRRTYWRDNNNGISTTGC